MDSATALDSDLSFNLSAPSPAPVDLMQLQTGVSGMLNELDQMRQDSEDLGDPQESPVAAVLAECWKDSGRNKDYHSQAVSPHHIQPVCLQCTTNGERKGLSLCA